MSGSVIFAVDLKRKIKLAGDDPQEIALSKGMNAEHFLKVLNGHRNITLKLLTEFAPKYGPLKVVTGGNAYTFRPDGTFESGNGTHKEVTPDEDTRPLQRADAEPQGGAG